MTTPPPTPPDSAGAPLSPANPRIRTLQRLANQRRARRQAGLALVEGPTLVAEALASAPARVREVYTEWDLDPATVAACAANAVPVIPVRDGGLRGVLDTVNPQPVVATVSIQPATVTDLAPDRPVLMAVEIRDPGNLGSLVRVAEAAGCAGVVLAGDCVDLAAPKVIRAAAGAWLRLPVVEIDDPVEAVAVLAGQGRDVWASVVSPSAQSLWACDLTRAVIVLGNEAHGLAPAVVDAAGRAVVIPHDGPTESLNLATAGAVFAFEALRQRRAGHTATPTVRPVDPGAP